MAQSPIPAQFAVGTKVVRESLYSSGELLQGTITRVTKTRATVELTATNGKTITEQYITPRWVSRDDTLIEYGYSDSFRSGSTLHLADSPRLVVIREQTAKKARQRAVKNAATNFGKVTPTVEAAEALIAELQKFIDASK